jgi:hypothetical protein
VIFFAWAVVRSGSLTVRDERQAMARKGGVQCRAAALPVVGGSVVPTSRESLCGYGSEVRSSGDCGGYVMLSAWAVVRSGSLTVAMNAGQWESNG